MTEMRGSDLSSGACQAKINYTQCVSLDLINAQCESGEEWRISDFSPNKNIKAYYFFGQKN